MADSEHTLMVLEVLLLVRSRAGADFGVFLQCCSYRAVPFSLLVVSCHLFCFRRKEDVSYMKKSNHVLNHVGDGPEEAEVLIRDKKHNRKPSFLKALLRTFGPYFLIGSFFKLIQDLLSFVNPQLLRLVYSVSSFYVQSLWRLGFGTGCLFLKCRVSFPPSATCVCSLTFPCNALRQEFFVVDSAVNWTSFTEMHHLQIAHHW